MAEAALRALKDVLGPRVEVRTADIGLLQVTAATAAESTFTLSKLANQAKADSIVLFDWGNTTLSSGAQLTNKRIFTNYTDRKLIFAAFDVVCYERASVTSGSVLFASLDAGTTALAGLSRTASLAGGTTTAMTNGAQLSLASGASIRMRQSAYTAGTFSRFSKIIGHYRASAV